jgi:hypothetical protein
VENATKSALPVLNRAKKAQWPVERILDDKKKKIGFSA